MIEKSIIFTHIQKTAGTSIFNELIAPNYDEKDIRWFWGGFGIKKLALTNTKQYKIFTGHMPYGIHHFISQKCDYITFLREPIARAISHYYFIKNDVDWIEQPNVYQKLHNDYSLSEIFNKTTTINPFKATLVDNMQTRFLAGYLYYNLPKNSELLLNKAKENLKNNYRVFGIQEKYSESIQAIASEFNWKHKPSNKIYKVTKQKEVVDEETMKALKENHLLDIELYNYAVQLFEKKHLIK